MQEKLQILRTKLHPPPIRSDLVYRTDLIEKLNYNYQKKCSYPGMCTSRIWKEQFD